MKVLEKDFIYLNIPILGLNKKTTLYIEEHSNLIMIKRV